MLRTQKMAGSSPAATIARKSKLFRSLSRLPPSQTMRPFSVFRTLSCASMILTYASVHHIKCFVVSLSVTRLPMTLSYLHLKYSGLRTCAACSSFRMWPSRAFSVSRNFCTCTDTARGSGRSGERGSRGASVVLQCGTCQAASRTHGRRAHLRLPCSLLCSPLGCSAATLLALAVRRARRRGRIDRVLTAHSITPARRQTIPRAAAAVCSSRHSPTWLWTKAAVRLTIESLADGQLVTCCSFASSHSCCAGRLEPLAPRAVALAPSLCGLAKGLIVAAEALVIAPGLWVTVRVERRQHHLKSQRRCPGFCRVAFYRPKELGGPHAVSAVSCTPRIFDVACRRCGISQTACARHRGAPGRGDSAVEIFLTIDHVRSTR